jgi:hypothetical protein
MLGLVVLALLGGFCSSLGESVSDYSVLVSASVQTNPPRVTLSWPADPQAASYSVYRKARDTASWGTATSLPANATGYVDSSVTVGTNYEYRISKTASSYSGAGYVYVGLAAPLVESRGKIILIVDSSCATELAVELTRLQQDLAGDGWSVLRHDVARMTVDPADASSTVWTARSNEVATVKALIKADYLTDTANVKAVFLFGHVPIPYSGNLAPDQHAEHVGAWPADLFYADMDGTWTDVSVYNMDASDARNWNVPGDGKFDQNIWPSTVELQVGRVDFANLPSFPQNEKTLLRQYLNKDHNFRSGLITAQRRGLIDDNFGVSSGEAFAADGWRNFAPFFGTANLDTGSWPAQPSTTTYLWGYGCGPGTPTSASGVTSTSELVSSDTPIIFTMLFGSWFGDWDSTDNLLRSQLATPGYTLATVWAGRPFWYFHHMAAGETLGFSARVTQNNVSTYSPNSFPRFVHIGLLGDPSLRMHVVAPPSNLTARTNGLGGTDLAWSPSADAIAGYYVYRSASTAGPFTRLTSSLLGSTNYTDPIISSNVYMVRAVKLESSPSGTYSNGSQGIFRDASGAFGSPLVWLFAPTNNSVVLGTTNLQLSASLLDPANCVTNISLYVDGLRLGSRGLPPYSVTWSNPPTGLHILTARANCASGLVTNSSAVNVQVLGQAPTLSIAQQTNGSFVISGDGIPGQTYHLQFVDDLASTNWQALGTVTSDSSGHFGVTVSAGPNQRFYRTVYP